MKVRFDKDVAVDYSDCRWAEIIDKSFKRYQTVEIAAIENKGKFVNLHFENGDLAIDVPTNSFTVV